jgi:hypothetical protein
VLHSCPGRAPACAPLLSGQGSRMCSTPVRAGLLRVLHSCPGRAAACAPLLSGQGSCACSTPVQAGLPRVLHSCPGRAAACAPLLSGQGGFCIAFLSLQGCACSSSLCAGFLALALSVGSSLVVLHGLFIAAASLFGL